MAKWWKLVLRYLKFNGKRIASSLACLLLACFFLYLLLRDNQGKTLPLLAIVYKYSYPEISMAFMSLLFISLIWLLAWFLFYQRFVKEMSFAGLTIVPTENTPRVLQFIFGLSPTLLAAFAAVSILALLSLPASCEVPGVIFTVRAGSGDPIEYTPESDAVIEPAGSSIVFLKSYPSEEDNVSLQDDLYCQFQAIGDIVERTETPFRQACLSTIYLKKNQPGRMVVKADVSGKYCKISSSYNLSVIVK